MRSPSPVWHRPAVQARSRATLDRILAAAAAVLEEKGFHELTIPDVTARAGCAVGTFYRRFPDKQALLEKLFETFERDAAEELAGVAGAMADPTVSLRRVVYLTVRGLVDFYRARGGLIRALQIGSETEPSFEERASRVQAALSELFERALRMRRRAFAARDPRGAADFAVWMMLGVLNQQLAFAPMRVALSDTRLVAHLERAVLGYLGSKEGSS